MEVKGSKDMKTGRLVGLHLKAHRASDEILLTELYEVFSEGSIRSIIITGAHNSPDQVFQWVPDGFEGEEE